MLPDNHALIHELAAVYTAALADIKRTILRMLEAPVRCDLWLQGDFQIQMLSFCKLVEVQRRDLGFVSKSFFKIILYKKLSYLFFHFQKLLMLLEFMVNVFTLLNHVPKVYVFSSLF